MSYACTPREMMVNSQMSHQTGAGLRTLSFQTTELMKRFRQAKPVYTMFRHVPIFQADAKLELI